MIIDRAYEPLVHETLTMSNVETWASSIPRLHQEIERLNELLIGLESDEKDSQEQLKSLTYALGLTRGEVKRRQRSNTELRSAYQFGSENSISEEESKKQFNEVQRLEEELLNAKRDSANIEYEVEQLQFRLKRMQESSLSSPIHLHEAVSPTSPALRSPQLRTMSSNSMSTPQSRPSRLIGDVDALVKFSESEEYLPCRLGVSGGGRIALYSYADTMPVIQFDESSVTSGELSKDDKVALKDNLAAIEVFVEGERFNLVGLNESITAAVQLLSDANNGIRGSDG